MAANGEKPDPKRTAAERWRVDYNKAYHRGYRAGAKLPNGGWIARAEEARERASIVTSEKARTKLLAIADEYDELAKTEF